MSEELFDGIVFPPLEPNNEFTDAHADTKRREVISRIVIHIATHHGAHRVKLPISENDKSEINMFLEAHTRGNWWLGVDEPGHILHHMCKHFTTTGLKQNPKINAG